MTNDSSTVFVVDDDRAVVAAITRLLRAEGYQVRSFNSAAAFLDAHDAAVVGCALLDFSLPDMDGLQIQAALTGAHYARPVVFLSGTSNVPTSVEAMKCGAVDFLVKPVRRLALSRAIRAAIEKDTEQRQASADQAVGYRLERPLSTDPLAMLV